MSSELAVVDAKLRYYSGEVKDTAEGRQLLKLYKSKMKLVKSKIRSFKREVKWAKKAAQKENDRIKALLGNNGYFMKNGETVEVDYRKYNAVGSESRLIAESSRPVNDEATIDLIFME